MDLTQQNVTFFDLSYESKVLVELACSTGAYVNDILKKVNEMVPERGRSHNLDVRVLRVIGNEYTGLVTPSSCHIIEILNRLFQKDDIYGILELNDIVDDCLTSKDIGGNTLIHGATYSKPLMLKCLLKVNPLFARVTSTFLSNLPLHICSNKECIELLVAAFPESLNAKNDCGMTPLHTAAKRGSLIAVETLLKLGANPSIIDNRRQKPIELAIVGDPKNRSYERIVKLLEGGGFTKSAMKH